MMTRRQKLLAAFGVLLLLMTFFLFSFDIKRHFALGDDMRLLPPMGGDFWFFWAAGRLSAQGTPLLAYDAYALREQMSLAGSVFNVKATPFFYPPHHLLLLTPLGFLSYLQAWAVYFFLGLVAFLGAVWLVTRRLWMVGAMAGFSGIWLNMVNGQNGLYTAALVGIAMALLARRPVAAGGVIGLLTIKPHLGLLWPVALISGRKWKIFAVAAGVTLACIAGMTLLYGPSIWLEYFKASIFASFLLDDAGRLYHRMPTLYSTLHVLHVAPLPAVLAQGALGLVVIYYLFKLWRSSEDSILRLGLLAPATLLVTPYVFDYDLAMLAWPAVALGFQPKLKPYEYFTILLAYFWPVLSLRASDLAGMPVGWVGPLFIFAVVARRMAVERA